MAKQRYINTKFWSDTFISELNALDKYLFLYFLTNEHTNISGIYEVPLKSISFETGIEIEALKKMLKRLHGKIEYVDGWVCIKNFQKNQSKESKTVQRGIEIEKARVPLDIIKKIEHIYSMNTPSIPYTYPAIYSNSNSNSNSNILEQSSKLPEEEFSLKGEIQKLEENPRRDLNIIGLYFKRRLPDIKSKEQYAIALKRHLKPAKDLIPFTNDQLIDAIDYAQREYKSIYTLETLIKILTK